MPYRFFRLYLLVLVSLGVTSCAVTNPYNEQMQPVSLLQEAIPHIASTKVIVGLDPKNSMNFIPQHHVSSGQQHGLLGVLIESMIVRSMNASLDEKKRLMTPIRSAAINFNFGSNFRQKLENNIKDINWLNIKYITKAPRFQRFAAEGLMKESQETTILVADTFYKMAEDFSKMTITAYMVLLPNTPELHSIARKQLEIKGEKIPVLARHQYSVVYEFEGGFVNNQQAAEGWAKDNAAMVHRALETGVANLAKSIASHLKTTWIIVAQNVR